MRRIPRRIFYILPVLLALIAVCCGAAPVWGYASAAGPYGNGGSRVERVVREGEALNRRVYIGGEQVGFTLNLNGVQIVEFGEVDTPAGRATLKSELKSGDVILKIDGQPVESADDVVRALNSGSARGEAEVEVLRGDERFTATVTPLIDRVSGEYRLGAQVRSDIAGIGTVTFVKRDGRFGALGHSVGGVDGAKAIAGGTVYGCKQLGIERGTRGKAGSIRGACNRSEMLGEVDKSIKYGVYGRLDKAGGELYDIADRDEVSCGKAEIRSSVSGECEFYDVEIVRTVYQPSEGERGMVIKVMDKRLIDLTGGIIQGMSGSPIVQNGKIVGAVTHVFVNDPLRGYGVYIDWMIGN